MSKNGRRYAAIQRAFFNEPWAIDRDKLDQIVGLLEMRAGGIKLSRQEILEMVGEDRIAANNGYREEAKKRRPFRFDERTGIAVLNLFGVVAKRMDIFTAFSGGTSTDRLGYQFRAALKDEEVKAILFDVDSPGGSVDGVEELSDAIFRGRSVKPIYGIANPEAASAAYWIATAVETLYVSPGGRVGSVGVFMVHRDDTERDKKEGLNHTVIKAGRFKAEGLHEPLSKEARAHRQDVVDFYYSKFVTHVARNRGLSVDAVIKQFGQGRMVLEDDAQSAGMVDGVATFDSFFETIAATIADDSENDRELYPAGVESAILVPAGERK